MLYGVFNKNDDEIFMMNTEGVWHYLNEHASAIFQNYSVVTDGNDVVVSEVSAGANGSFGRQSINEFYASFEEDYDIVIRPISEFKGVS